MPNMFEAQPGATATDRSQAQAAPVNGSSNGTSHGPGASPAQAELENLAPSNLAFAEDLYFQFVRDRARNNIARCQFSHLVVLVHEAL